MRAPLILIAVLSCPSAAMAGEGPVYVIPGRAGVPVMINGVDASYAVVEGDWGLARRIHVQPTVFFGRRIDPDPRVGHYYPGFSKPPGYGRLEIEPPPSRPKPPPAESYHQSWSIQSAPAAQPPPVPMDPPQVILAPRQDRPLPPSVPTPRRNLRP